MKSLGRNVQFLLALNDESKSAGSLDWINTEMSTKKNGVKLCFLPDQNMFQLPGLRLSIICLTNVDFPLPDSATKVKHQ